ncbi:MAG TPA: cellulose biosynthesis protein BcsS [Hyphomicrobiaceae bacterium]|nr:cellulose biosynthesis protein BcsS [Hyphomicrobiaceae bacterium]
MKHFFKITLGGLAAACAALPTAAGAADLGGSLKDAPVVAPAPAWSGIYFGGSAGYGHNRSDNIYSDSEGGWEKHHESADGGLISTVFGIDRQIGDRFVIGAFADFDWSNFDRGTANENVWNGLTITRAWSVGGRLGVLVTPRTLLYGTAGFTQAHFRNDGWWDIDGLGAGRRSRNFNGYFVGGGLEVMLRSNFFLRGELRYADYGDEITNAGTYSTGTYVDREDPEVFTGRLGIVYKLGREDHAPSALGMKDGGEDVDHTYKVVTVNGVDVSDDAWSIYSFNAFALNGDFDRDGFIFRTFGEWNQYSYKRTFVPGTDVDVDDRLADVMIGYQKVFKRFTAGAYVGYEIRDIDASPNGRWDSMHGTKSGFKVAVDVESADEEKFYYSLDSSYSTSHDSVYGQLRIGYNAGSMIVGPEGWVFSDDGDATWRVGGFAKMPFMLGPTRAAEFSIYGGYQFADDDNNRDRFTTHGGDGGYGGAALKVAF